MSNGLNVSMCCCCISCVFSDWSRHYRSRDQDRSHRGSDVVKRVHEDKFKGSLSEGQTLTIDLDSDEE